MSPSWVTAETRMPVEGARGDVGLAADDQSRALEELRLVPAELLEEHALLLLRASPLDAREVEEQDERHAPRSTWRRN